MFLEKLVTLLIENNIGASTGDFLLYWSAARLFITGQNPYDVDALSRVAVSAVPTVHPTIGVWNPPILFIIIGWLGLLPYRYAVISWFLCNAAIYVFSYVFIAKAFENTFSKLHDNKLRDVKRRTLIWYLLFPFYWQLMVLGQISSIVMLATSLTIFLGSRTGNLASSYGAGVSLALGCIKPHLILFPLATIGISSLLQRRFEFCIGFVVAVFLLIASSWLCNPTATTFYMSAPQIPLKWICPTLSSWTYFFIFNQNRMVFPAFLLLGGILLWFLKQKKLYDRFNLNFFSISLVIGMMVAPYGYSFDFVCVLPGLLLYLFQLGQIRSRRNLLILGSFGIASLIAACHNSWDYELVWYPVFLVIWTVASWKSISSNVTSS